MNAEITKMSLLFKAALISLILTTSVWAAESDHSDHMSMSSDSSDKNDMSMDNMKMENDGKPMTNEEHGNHNNMQHHDMNMPMSMTGTGMTMSNESAQGGSAPANARDPHAYSGGYKRDPLRRLKFADEYMFYKVMLDRLEVARSDGQTSEVFDLQAWYGYDYNRLVFKTEGDISDKTLEEASTELLWGHAIATFWNTQLGLRYDNGEGANRSWLAMGVQGLAPYWFELDTTFYVGEDIRTSLSIEAEYELLITQKLILQPRFETTLYGKSDAEKGVGSGLSDASLGLRLRYEFKREIATYVGFEWQSKFGDTADLAKASGASKSDNVLVAGLRVWF